MPGRLRGRILASLCLPALCSGFAAPADEVLVRITAPAADEILYGRTRVVAEIEPDPAVADVAFYLDQFESPICSAVGAPYVCEFDAGSDFQARRIRAVARDRAGKTLGQDLRETPAFVKPQRVVQYIVSVPVVASTFDDRPVDLKGLECLYAGEPCEVLGAERIRLTERTPLSVEMLVDVSPSVTPNRPELLQAVEALIAAFPDHAEMAIVEFAGNYRRLGPFTSDRDELRAQVRSLSANASATCLMRALENSLIKLKSRPGHRALIVISDGIDTCDSVAIGVASRYAKLITREEVLRHVVELSRSVGAPIYVYRLAEPSPGRMIIAPGGQYEGLALETGGRLFSNGTLYGMSNALVDLIDDVSRTWVVDIALPRRTETGPARRLRLVPRDAGDVELRYPHYWEADARETAWIAQLESGIDEVRLAAARRLADSVNPHALRALVDVIPQERDERIREIELRAVVKVSGRLLVHGDTRERKAALDAIEALEALAPERVRLLRPALALFVRLDVPRRMIRRAQRYHAGSAPGE